jgi:hypothetical protein
MLNKASPLALLHRLPTLLLTGVASLAKLLVTSLVIGIVGSLVAAVIFFRWVQPDLETITIPVFVRAQDKQGSQFALGVSRAIDLANRFALDRIGNRVVRPLFIDEDILREKAGPDKILSQLRAIRGKVPIAIGPLTSTDAEILLSTVAADNLPMILGIPTNTSLSGQFHDRVWRLSPTDDQQAKIVAGIYSKVCSKSSYSIVLWDSDKENPTYSVPLKSSISQELGNWEINRAPLPAALREVNIDTLGMVQAEIKARRPQCIVYVGMPANAKKLLQGTTSVASTWIFTDGAYGADLVAAIGARGVSKDRYIQTFQTPPAIKSRALRDYVWFTQSLGGNVLGIVDSKGCDAETAVTSFEAYGYDSYILALNLVQRANLEESRYGREGVIKVMQRSTGDSVNYNFLLMSPYKIVKGNNENARFYVYEFRKGCAIYSEGLN